MSQRELVLPDRGQAVTGLYGLRGVGLCLWKRGSTRQVGPAPVSVRVRQFTRIQVLFYVSFLPDAMDWLCFGLAGCTEGYAKAWDFREAHGKQFNPGCKGSGRPTAMGVLTGTKLYLAQAAASRPFRDASIYGGGP